MMFCTVCVGLVGINGQVRYVLDDNDRRAFAVDQKSGIVSVRVPLDRELRDKYNISVFAFDQVGVFQAEKKE